ncbi:hypothetical protein PR202_ga23286 [Eleusine coracana subsp. coracana]|uniref:Uncharacterized protein n=1 Tax=Eleusine coracana subsp. coracana TaxID=191504 RepID=A0AAV5D3U6_ELECO|nr:hypothetical protein PR202_ga23286 [Eleusine coracana subsp. coracana]
MRKVYIPESIPIKAKVTVHKFGLGLTYAEGPAPITAQCRRLPALAPRHRASTSLPCTRVKSLHQSGGSPCLLRLDGARNLFLPSPSAIRSSIASVEPSASYASCSVTASWLQPASRLFVPHLGSLARAPSASSKCPRGAAALASMTIRGVAKRRRRRVTRRKGWGQSRKAAAVATLGPRAHPDPRRPPRQQGVGLHLQRIHSDRPPIPPANQPKPKTKLATFADNRTRTGLDCTGEGGAIARDAVLVHLEVERVGEEAS